MKSARIVGALFLVAMVTSLAGGIWLETFLAAPDYMATISANGTQVLIGVLLELINCVAIVGIAAVLFPILKKQNEALALGYVGMRVIEAAILVAAAVSPLLLIDLSQEYVASGAADASFFQTLGALVIAARAHLASLLVPIFFGLGALLLYYLLYQTELVPRFIAVWGLVAVALMLAWNLLEAFGVRVSAGIVLALPMMLNEIFLGIWLIAKGFSSATAAPESPGQIPAS